MTNQNGFQATSQSDVNLALISKKYTEHKNERVQQSTPRSKAWPLASGWPAGGRWRPHELVKQTAHGAHRN